MDCESSAYYEGRTPGTIGISGYSEEYREYQISITPLNKVALQGTLPLPTIPLEKIVKRLRAIISSPVIEDDVFLRELLGSSL